MNSESLRGTFLLGSLLVITGSFMIWGFPGLLLGLGAVLLWFAT